MTSIYDQHQRAFARVSAYVIMRDGQRVATIAFKFPADGAGRLYCYLHSLGVPMVRSWANGYGYDKRTAAAVSAAHMIKSHGQECIQTRDTVDTIKAALSRDDGRDWERMLRDAGLEVWRAV
jgi:hypothetical protein